MKKESVKFIPFLLLLSLSSNATSQSAAQIAHATLTNAPLKWQSTYPKMPQVQHKVLASTFSANSNLINRTVFVGERGPHQRVWMKVADGQTNVSFIELATGMHYWEDNQWKESQELVESFPGGAIARHGQHKVIFAENLRTAGAIDMETPDGKRLRSHILGLSYFDSASGQSVLIAEIKNCIGQIVGSNQVVYSDAFDGIKADVRYTYTRASFEQDIILREQVPDPKEFGLNPGTTRLQVLTEFLNPPQPTIAARSIHRKNGEEIEDDTLDFGVMKFNDGKAFSAGKESGNISISKQWLNLDGRYRRRCRNKVRQFKFRSVDCEFAQLQYGALLHGDSHLH